MEEDRKYIFFADIELLDGSKIRNIYIGFGTFAKKDFGVIIGDHIMTEYCNKNKNIVKENSNYRMILIEDFLK